jgi:hypothetical protein
MIVFLFDLLVNMVLYLFIGKTYCTILRRPLSLLRKEEKMEMY